MYIATGADGRLVPINLASRGLSCGCTCISCCEPVIARHGDVREWHYAHVSNREACAISGETVIHLLVKQFIHDAGGWKVPPRPSGRLLAPPLEAAIDNDGWLKFERVEVEVDLETVRPDLVGYVGEAPLAIEVGYTSFCDLPKVEQFERMGLSALEIDVGGFDPQDYDECDMRHAVLTRLERMKWLFCSECQQQLPVVPFDRVQCADRPAQSSTYAPLRPDTLKTLVVAGRWVTVTKLPFGDIAIKYSYGEMVSRLVRERIGRRFGGTWNHKHKNWLFRSYSQQSILDEVSRLSRECP